MVYLGAKNRPGTARPSRINFDIDHWASGAFNGAHG
jgi:hypothetical protein